MGRTILTEEQKELIALIPKAIRNSKDFTNAAKLVLAQLDLQDGTDFSETNHYVFSSNDDLMKNTGIASKHTVINAIKKLVNEGLIETKRGYRKKGDIKASEYVLTDKYYELDGRENPHKQGCNKGCNKNEQGCNKGCNCTNSTNTVIEDMQQQINELREEIEKLQNALKKINCTSDTETDIEIEKEPDINNMLEYTCTGEDNSKNQHNMKIDERLITEDEKDVWEILDISDNFDYSQHEDISEMVQSDAGNIGMMENPTYFEKKKNNEYVSKMFRKLSYYIKEYKNSTSVEMANDWGCKVNDIYSGLDRSKFTESQLETISDMMDEFDYLFECKEKFLSKKYHKSNMMKKKSASNENAAKKVVADEDNEMMFRAYCTDEELIAMGFEVEEPMVAYGNSSVQEAQQQFAMALAANG